jgi:hypothetical protein
VAILPVRPNAEQANRFHLLEFDLIVKQFGRRG